MVTCGSFWDIALSITIGLGVLLGLSVFVVSRIVGKVANQIHGKRPQPTTRLLTPLWSKQEKSWPGERKGDNGLLWKSGLWIGVLESLLFFAAFWRPDAWPIAASWLVFKAVFYWESTNFTKLPDSTPEGSDADFLVDKQHLGTYHSAKVLIGTSANIVSALIGVACAHAMQSLCCTVIARSGPS